VHSQHSGQFRPPKAIHRIEGTDRIDGTAAAPGRTFSSAAEGDRGPKDSGSMGPRPPPAACFVEGRGPLIHGEKVEGAHLPRMFEAPTS